MAAERGETERGGELTHGEVGEENARSSCSSQSAHERSRPLFETGVLKQSDHWQDEPHDGDVAARYERFAKGGNDRERTEAAGDAGCEPRNSDYEERVDPESKSDDDDEYAYECEQRGSGSSLVKGATRYLNSSGAPRCCEGMYSSGAARMLPALARLNCVSFRELTTC